MSIQTCPTTMVEAPAELVWRLLTTPNELQRWSGLKIVKGPDRPLVAGDQIVFRAGLIRLQVMNLERLRRLELEVHFPFGIVNHEVFIITAESNGTCRVTYN
jgi:ligand-binding SRPBCC domain-containing protein